MFSFITVCDRSDLMVIAIACPVLAWPRECLTTGDDGGLRGRRASTVVADRGRRDAVRSTCSLQADYTLRGTRPSENLLLLSRAASEAYSS